jgi:hypothetical protein
MTALERGLAAARLLARGAPTLGGQDPGEAEPQPFARVRLEEGPTVTVGQPVGVVVEVLVPTWFTSAPSFPVVEIPDALVLLEGRGVNSTERIDFRTWAVQSRRYRVYPQRPGAFEISAVPVAIRYMSESGGPRTEVTVSPPAIAFDAELPPGTEDFPYFISTTGLELSQELDRDPTSLVVGEAFSRTIVATVQNALAMVIPPLSQDPQPGLAFYPDPPQVTDDGGARGTQIVGTRRERGTFVAEEVGDYTLPAIELVWWNLEAGTLERASLPAVRISVESNPDLAVEILPPVEDPEVEDGEADSGRRVSIVERLRRWAPPLAAVLLGAWLLTSLWKRVGSTVRERLRLALRRRAESEAAYFARFRRAALAGDPKATWNSLTSWLDRIRRSGRTATIRGFVEAAGDPDLGREVAALDAVLFSTGTAPDGRWSGRPLYRAVSRLRRRRAVSDSAGEQELHLNPR